MSQEKQITFGKEELEVLLDVTREGEREKNRRALIALSEVQHHNAVGLYCRRAIRAIARPDFYKMNSAEIIAFIFSGEPNAD